MTNNKSFQRQMNIYLSIRKTYEFQETLDEMVFPDHSDSPFKIRKKQFFRKVKKKKLSTQHSNFRHVTRVMVKDTMRRDIRHPKDMKRRIGKRIKVLPSNT